MFCWMEVPFVLNFICTGTLLGQGWVPGLLDDFLWEKSPARVFSRFFAGWPFSLETFELKLEAASSFRRRIQTELIIIILGTIAWEDNTTRFVL